jgi:hypothetical protein
MADLDDLLDAQAEIQRRVFGHDFSQMSDVERIAFIKETVLATTAELYEALNETGWKGWSASRHIFAERYLAELADVFIFFMHRLLASGYSVEDCAFLLADEVRKKQKLNIQRQESGY